MPAGERERNVACDLSDLSWFDKVNGNRGPVFVVRRLEEGIAKLGMDDRASFTLCQKGECPF